MKGPCSKPNSMEFDQLSAAASVEVQNFGLELLSCWKIVVLRGYACSQFGFRMTLGDDVE